MRTETNEPRPTATAGRPWRVLVALLALMLFAAACGSSDDDASDAGEDSFSQVSEESSDDGDTVAVEGAADDVDTAADDEVAAPSGGSGGLSDTAGLPVVDTGRDIIFTATISVEVDDIVAAGEEASATIADLGGVLFGQVTTSEGVPRSTLTFKVPPAQFQTALSRLGGIGFLRDQIVTADDVTERVVDLESQIVTAELSVERLRGFLEQATTLTEIAELEQQLLERETTLEQLRGQLRTIEGQVSLATITVTFEQQLPGPELTVEQTAYFGHDEGGSCPGVDELSGDEGESLTVCIRITNSGDTALADLEVRDDDLDLELDDFSMLDGSIDDVLGVGESVTLFAEVEAEPFRNGRAQVTALPVSDGGVDLQLGRLTARGDLDLDIDEDLSLPGFLDGLSAGWAALLQVVGVIVLLAGVLLPFVWLVPLLWWLRRWRRARRAAKMPPPPGRFVPSATSSPEPSAPTAPAGSSAASEAGSVERRQGTEAEG